MFKNENHIYSCPFVVNPLFAVISPEAFIAPADIVPAVVSNVPVTFKFDTVKKFYNKIRNSIYIFI